MVRKFSLLVIPFIIIISCSTTKETFIDISNQFSKMIEQFSENIKQLSEDIDEREEEKLKKNVDLSDPTRKYIHDALESIDYDHAYQIFLQSPNNLMIWIYDKENIDMGMLAGAVHEANHMLNSNLSFSSTSEYQSKYFFLGDIYTTGLNFENTVNYSIVEETIPQDLKSHNRYKTYIEGSKDVNGNNFSVILDEFTAYLGGALFEYRYFISDRMEVLPSNQTRTSDSNPAGTVNFMVYLQCYLKSARANYTDAYNSIKTQRSTLRYIETLWSAAERMLVELHPYTIENKTRIKFAIPIDYFKAAFSKDLLEELDLLGIPHMHYSDWSQTYLQ
jgi:hypothetical protein